MTRWLLWGTGIGVRRCKWRNGDGFRQLKLSVTRITLSCTFSTMNSCHQETSGHVQLHAKGVLSSILVTEASSNHGDNTSIFDRTSRGNTDIHLHLRPYLQRKHCYKSRCICYTCNIWHCTGFEQSPFSFPTVSPDWTKQPLIASNHTLTYPKYALMLSHMT